MLLVPDDLFGGPVIFVSPPSPHAQAAVPGGVLCPEWPRDQRAGLVLRAHLPRLFLVLSKYVFYNDFILLCKILAPLYESSPQAARAIPVLPTQAPSS